MLSPDWFNFMRSVQGVGTSQCLNHFTSGQVSRMHGVLEQHLSNLYISPSALGISILEDMVIDKNTEFFTNVWVNPGVTLTIKNVTVHMADNINLHIAAGARLILENAKITACEESWLGVTCSENAISVELKDESIIEKAVIGIKLKNLPFATQTLDPSFNHPTLIMHNNCIIQDCDIGIQFGAGKTESMIDFGCTIKNNGIGIKYQNHTGLIINSSSISYNEEAIHSIDGYMNVRLFTRIHHNTVGIRVEGTLPAASGIQVGDNGSIPNWIFSNTEAGIISNGSEHPAGVVVNNTVFTDNGDAAFVVLGANDFDFTNNIVKGSDRGAFVMGSGDNPNALSCNEFENIELVSALVAFSNPDTKILENHFLGRQEINIGTVFVALPDQGLLQNPAANCFSDADQSAHIVNTGFLIFPPVSFIYHYHNDDNMDDPCQIPIDPANYVATVSDDQGVGNCGGNVGIFSLISTGGGGHAVGLDPQYENPEEVCLDCVREEIEDWIDVVVNAGGDDPTTMPQEDGEQSDPDLGSYEAILDQWINYALYIAIQTDNIAYAQQVLEPLVTWKWRTRLYGILAMKGDLNTAEIILDALPEDTENQIQFKEVQEVNLKRMKGEAISTSDIDHILTIAEGMEPSSGFARSLHGIIANTLPIDYPDIHKDGSPRSTKMANYSAFKLYPNPSSIEIVHCEWDAPISNIIIVDVNGRQIFQQRPNAFSIHIDMNKFESGVYICRIEDENGRTETQKLIKI